jgi:hypothetical protein
MIRIERWPALLAATLCVGCSSADPESAPTPAPAENDRAAAPAAAPTPAAAPGPAESTRRMAERLENLARTADPGKNLTVGVDARIGFFRRQLEQSTDLARRTQAAARMGQEQLGAGRTEEAIATYVALRDEIAAAGTRVSPRTAHDLGALRAAAYLRLGEQQNCLARHGPDSCLMPIRGGGVHVDKEGSTLALAELTALLEADPDDLASLWLLNLAHMTLGTYPDGVPERWLIPEETFASDAPFPRFPNEATRLGVDVVGLSGGVVLEDLDGDGRLDIMASDWGMREQLRLFRNTGEGTFAEVTDAAGLTGEVGGLNLCHADYDNDGDADVLVLRGAWLRTEGRHPNSLLRNEGDGTFTDVTEAAGLLSFHPTQAAAWTDYDGDGWLDLFIGNESVAGGRHPCELFRNEGDGTFTEIAADVGLAHVGFVKGVACGDYDNDDRPDLYLSMQGEPNVLYRNEGPAGDGWRFRDVTADAGVAEPDLSFPTWFFDYDNDGWLDLYVAPFPGFWGNNLASIAADYLDRPTEAERARLFRNRGDGTFEDVSEATGMSDAMLAMGGNFGDLDNDGYLDVYIGSGEPNMRTLVPNRMYRNAGGARFDNVTTAGGFGHLQKGHGIGFADLDNDGDQDIYAVMGGAFAGDVAYNALFLNPGHDHRWITLVLEGNESNRAAIGARIRVVVDTPAGEREIHRVVCTGGSFGSSSLRQEIGLGDATSIRAIEVRWPTTGLVQRFDDVEPDRAYRVREGDDDLAPLAMPPVRLSTGTAPPE